MLRNDDSDMEDYDSDEECDFGFDVDDFFFHIFGFVISNVKFIEICWVAGFMWVEGVWEEDSAVEFSGDDILVLMS